MKRWLKKFLILLVLAGAGYTVYARLAHHDGSPNAMMMGGGAAPVDVAMTLERETQIWHEFSGRLVAAEQAEIRPRVSGMIESVLFTDGARVNKDDPLFKIDPAPYQAAFDQASGALTEAQAQAVLATGDFSRAIKLFKEKALSQRDFDQRKNARDSAQARLESAQAALQAAQLNLDYTDIKAPFSGRAGRAEITVGNIVGTGPGAPVLTVIVADTPIYADFEMDEASFLRYTHTDNEKIADIPVRLGLSSETGTPHSGRIGSFDNRLDPRSGTVRVRAVFDNEDGALVPGLFARIRIGEAETVKAVLITDRAIGTDQDKKFVLIVGNDSKVEYREIKPGASVDGLRSVDSGLLPGEKIVVGGLQRARPGAIVTPHLVDMATGESLEPVPAAKDGP